MIILDTNIITHYAHGHPNVLKHLDAVPEGEDIAVTVVTRGEILRGRTDSLLKAANEAQLREATLRLQEAERILDGFLLFHVDEEAIRHFGLLQAEEVEQDEAGRHVDCLHRPGLEGAARHPQHEGL